MKISFILPCYRRAHLLAAMLPFTTAYQHPDCEVVLVLDEPGDEFKIMEIVRANPDIKFRVVVNDAEHDWRPPCIPINVGIRHAEGSHVAILSPETAIVTNWCNHLVDLVDVAPDDCFVGSLWHIQRLPTSTADFTVAEFNAPMSYTGGGFRLVPKETLESIFGYDESRTSYGGDDTDIQCRITRNGCRTVIDPNIKLFTLWHDAPRCTQPEQQPVSTKIVLNQPGWGFAFNRVTHDWRKP